jgi:hypothetical protein
MLALYPILNVGYPLRPGNEQAGQRPAGDIPENSASTSAEDRT